MTRYMELSRELGKVLEQRKQASNPGSRYGLTPARGKEGEWDRLNKEAEVIRAVMRRIRYGTE